MIEMTETPTAASADIARPMFSGEAPCWASDDGNVQLWNADCLDVLPLLSGVDVVVTDPPYMVQAGKGGGAFGNWDSLVNTGGFTDAGVDHSFVTAFENWVVFCSIKQLHGLIEIAEQYPRWNLITWAKPNPVPTCCNKYLPDVEYIVHGFGKGKLFGDYKDKQSFFHQQTGKKVSDHPNEKPVPLMMKMVALAAWEGATVLDPFMGSGTTGVACIRSGRKFIGIERDAKYFEIAKERIRKELQVGRLF
jgi:site-specific DNA-methyltransferase (adenine-specific)